jgi:ATP-dependent Clp protease protease subunit
VIDKTGTSPRSQVRSPDDAYNQAAIEDMQAERDYYRAEEERIRYELMELRTGARARRTYTLGVEVSEDSARELIEALSDWGAESRNRITLRLMTPGGDVVAGLAIYDFIVALRGEGIPVDTLAIGWAASMGSILLQAGERRYVAPNASVLIHESRFSAEDQPMFEKITDMEDRLRFEQDLIRRMDRILTKRAVMNVRELRERYARKDWWLTARETVDLGFADAIHVV